MKRLAIHLAILGLAAPAAAQPTHELPHAAGIESKGYVWNNPDEEKTRALKHKGDPAHGQVAYEICRGCHGANAAGRDDAIYPQLAGQHSTVLIKQIVDIRAGRRDNPKMHPFVGNWVVSAEEIGDIAAYLSGLPIPKTNTKGNGANFMRGKSIYDASCAVCHGERGEGDSRKFFPRVAAQHYDYLVNETVQIRDGWRRNANPKMVKAIKSYSDKDLEAVSDYMSRLQPPEPKSTGQ